MENCNEYFNNKLSIDKGKKIIRVSNKPQIGLYSKVIGYKLLDEALNLTCIHHPKIVAKKFFSDVIDIEVLETKTKIESLEKTYFIENFEYYLLEGLRLTLSKRNEKISICKKIKKLEPWNNNTTFLKFQLDNMKLFIENHESEIENLREIKQVIYELENATLDDARPMALIHGDVNNKNIVQQKASLIYVNWNMGCIGDIAYEIAIFSLNMNYQNSDRLNINIEEKRIVDKIGRVYPQINIKKLKSDIDIYKKLEKCRRYLYNL